ncbi:GIY-YIG nuclease family protein [Rhodobacter sp. KR11]|uniref:GIY-YIG nuclease family protein n=1 Tax=Rhodobacter sp. KR11 TaxID=2974588 RepID=UPI00222342F8|nr:GIY-YIG nuclease family protein [Rhodobacter sp. KR11]MCW1919707.1 GIY-YIG nuclease family protein [Rhodobacter sp. KR11]
MGFGKSLELFFVNGKPDQIVTARMFGWTGHVLKAPRTQIVAALQRAEAQHVGLYILLGHKDQIRTAYIGQAETLAKRIGDHVAAKDWWETAILITTVANDFHRAHVTFLESLLIEKARTAKAVVLENGTGGTTTKLSEAAVASMMEFLDTLDVVLPALGVDVLTDKAAALPPQQSAAAPALTLVNRKHGIEAHARLLEGAFVVLHGSQARGSWEAKTAAPGAYEALREKRVSDGVLQPAGASATFAKDYKFDSPSAAAAVCHGRTANGRLDWKHDASGLTYAAWEVKETAS